GSQPVEAPAIFSVPGVVLSFIADFALFDQSRFEQRLDGTIKRARPEAHLSVGLLFHLAHDGVSVQLFPRERKQDLERGGGQWFLFSFRNVGSDFAATLGLCQKSAISKIDYGYAPCVCFLQGKSGGRGKAQPRQCGLGFTSEKPILQPGILERSE